MPDARLPATLPAKSGVNLTALNASNLGSGTVPTARLGSGTASSSTFLRGDSTYAEAGGGKLLQCLTATQYDVWTSTATYAFTDISGLTVNITPASGTKILVIANVNWTRSASSYVGGWRMIRDSTPIGVATNTSNRKAYSGTSMYGTWDDYTIQTDNAHVLDTHGADGSTQITYKCQFYHSAGNWFLNRTRRDFDHALYDGRTISAITVMEIGA